MMTNYTEETVRISGDPAKDMPIFERFMEGISLDPNAPRRELTIELEGPIEGSKSCAEIVGGYVNQMLADKRAEQSRMIESIVSDYARGRR